MQPTFLNYEVLHQIHESANSVVYRARHQTDGTPVILKLLKDAYPSPEKIAWFQREFELTHSLNPQSEFADVAAAYSLHNEQNRWMIVLEDFGATSLSRVGLMGRLAPLDFLSLALKLTAIVGQLHQQHIIHKDINPSNIVIVQPEADQLGQQHGIDWQMKLIDFGLATQLSRETTTFRNPNILEGTLAYISPEQTGRMNRAIDYRSDFYSLGVTFYELLTGHIPFDNRDALELVHQHIAQAPRPPHKLNPDIPEMFSKIVLKLMAKNAEERYQSAQGLQADLENCREQWQTQAKIDLFELGQQDRSDRFQLPQKLYGREQELESLVSAFKRASQGASEIALVAGYSGVGKTALIQELYKPLTEQQGYFISGKFDQLQRNIPYASLMQACRLLTRQLLTESDLEIVVWREKLLDALGTSGQVLIEVIPELERIIGPQPTVSELEASESENRFNLLLQRFINLFTQPDHPLVIFLDDLQWADVASLKFLERMMTDANSHHLFLIGAYRDNEVDAAHPLMATIGAVRKAGFVVNQLDLTPLALTNVTQFVAETLHCLSDAAIPLAELLVAKTQGNPFFMGEFLKTLYAEQLLTFDYQHGGWLWDLAQIQAQAITDNVIQLMANKVEQLPDQTRTVLERAACLGNQFDLAMLAIVAELPAAATAGHLWPALQAGLITPLSDNYKLMELDVEGLTNELQTLYQFTHDRIQQAVYAFISEEEKKQVHLNIGRLMQQKLSPAELEQQLFDVVNHFNVGRSLMRTQTESDAIAALNLKAGQKAKESAAHQSAYDYFETGLQSLDSATSWQSMYELTLALHTEAAETSVLAGDYQRTDYLTEQVLNKAQNVLDKVRIYEVLVRAYYAQSNFPKSLESGKEVLALLDITFPAEPKPEDVGAAVGAVHVALDGRAPHQLLTLPPMTNPEKKAAMRIMNNLIGLSWRIAPELYPLLVCNLAKLSLEYGYADESPMGYTCYGSLLAFGNNFEEGYQFGRLAVQLIEQFGLIRCKSSAYQMTGFLLEHLKTPLSDVQRYFLESYYSGIETGEVAYGSYGINNYCQTVFHSGKNLGEVSEEIAKYSPAIARLNESGSYYWHRICWQMVLNLMGESENSQRLVGSAYNEEELLPIHVETNDFGSLVHAQVYKMMIAHRFQAYPEALESTLAVEQLWALVEGSFLMVVVYLYPSLTRLALYPDASAEDQTQFMEIIEQRQTKLKLLAEHAPMNYAHKYHLVEAEKARVLGQDDQAANHYDQAINLANEHGNIGDEALAYELAGQFYLAKQQDRLAYYYLRDAHYAYQLWGAQAKVDDLEKRYPELLSYIQLMVGGTHRDRTTTASTTGSQTSSRLDTASVLKASQAISGEIDLDKLLTRLMQIIIENAGAEKGYLLLEEQGEWLIEAEIEINQNAVAIRQGISLDAGRVSASIANYVIRTHENIVLVDASAAGQFTQDTYVLEHQPKSVLCMPIINQGRLNGVIYLENNLATDAFTQERVELLNLLSSQASISLENARLYQDLELSLERQVELTQSYSRFVPPEYLKFLNKKSITELNLGDHISKEMAVMFSDIRGFTTISEKMTSQENFSFVNAYLQRVSPSIREHDGIIVKFLGDGMMAVFQNGANDAVQAGIAKLQTVIAYNQHRIDDGWEPIQVGVGIHIGPMMVGMVGETSRMQGDAFSDNVNLTARLEGLTRIYGVTLIISKEVIAALPETAALSIRYLDKVVVKGRTAPLDIYEILDGLPQDAQDAKIATMADFKAGVEAWQAGDMQGSEKAFSKVIEANPQDMTAQLYMERIAEMMAQGLPDDFDGITWMTEK